MAVAAKKTVMTLYSDPTDPYSHQVRIVLAAKGVNADILEQKPEVINQDLLKINPYHTVPTLIDRDLVLYEARIIMEYLDERFPHPPLLPVYPVMRAQFRKMMYRIDRDWYSLAKTILNADNQEETENARKQLAQSLISLDPVFADKAFFFSEEFSLIDCCLAPLLWRLPQLGVELPAKTKAVRQYADQVFSLDAFQASLTEMEREIRVA